MLLVAIAVASCAKNTIYREEIEPMVFCATASHSTKAIITTTNYPLDVPFVVQAVHYPKNTSEEVTYIEREPVSYDFSHGLWRTESDYYWPAGGTLIFYAGSPIAPQISFSEEHGVIADWAITTEAETQQDLCFAEVKENCEAHSAAIPIVFSHALSQVCFKARVHKQLSYSRNEGTLIQANIINAVLDSVKIGGIVSKGVFTQKPREWTLNEGATAEYLVYKNEEGLPLNCDRYDAPILEKIGNFLLIPQPLGEGAYLEEWHHVIVRSSVTDTQTGQIISDETTVWPKTYKLPLRKNCPEWKTDFKYTFRLAVGLDTSDITYAVTDWTETKEIIIGDE